MKKNKPLILPTHCEFCGKAMHRFGDGQRILSKTIGCFHNNEVINNKKIEETFSIDFKINHKELPSKLIKLFISTAESNIVFDVNNKSIKYSTYLYVPVFKINSLTLPYFEPDLLNIKSVITKINTLLMLS